MFLNRDKKNNVYPCKPQFYYVKVGFKGGQNYIGMFSWWCLENLQCGGRYREQIVMDLDRVTFTATACTLLFISICL